MAMRWKKGCQPEHILDKIESIRRVDPEGKVQFQGFGFKEYEAILFGLIDFGDNFPEAEARYILWRALVTVGKTGVLTQKKLKAEINKRVAAYLQTPTLRYALLTSLSIQSKKPLERIRIGHDHLIFDNVPSRFHKEAKPLLDKAKYSVFGVPPDNYLPVRIHVSSRSIHEAADLALDHLDLIRAIWNLFFNMRQSFRWSYGGKSKPVNKIITGPIHTLHHTNGKLLSKDIWWYDPSFIEAVPPQDIHSDVDKLNAFTNLVLSKLSKTDYALVVKDALRRYVRALDERNLSNAYIHLWSVLETLTNTLHDRYDVTIRRAAFIFEERDYHYQVLQNLREYRNRYVHHGASDSGVESYLYQLKNIVEALLRFHLNNSFNFTSIKEAAEFLSLPYEENSLKSKNIMIKNAIKFRRYE